MGAVKFSKIPIEGAQRQMTGLAGNFQNETIGEAQRGARAEMCQRQSDDIGILKRQVLVMQQECDRVCDLRRRALLHRVEHP